MEFSIRQHVIQQVQSLSETELHQVSEYVAFLRFRARAVTRVSFDPKKVAALYAEFADEDRDLAEEGLAEYNEQLLAEETV